MKRSHRGFRGAIERAWSGEPGAWAWTRALLPAAGAYAAVSSAARSRARGTRRGVAGLYVAVMLWDGYGLQFNRSAAARSTGKLRASDQPTKATVHNWGLCITTIMESSP